MEKMAEDFLHYIWKLKLFSMTDLKTTSGEAIEIIKVGNHNFDAGPDFFNAKIKIGSTVWAGNVEIHVNGKDWKQHNHQSDKAYDNIILHVVNNNDCDIKRSSGEGIPTLELKERINPNVFKNYTQFKTSKDWVPCEKIISTVPQLIINSTIDKLVLERLERKSIAIKNSLKLNNFNWEETFYQQLANNFGFKVNTQPFELLAKSIPVKVLASRKDSLFQLEALLFGQSGLLQEHFQDKYLQDLQNEYSFLSKKHQLVPIEKHLWKFMRLRPANFPTIRIAQFASLLSTSSHLFSKVIEAKDVKSLKQLFDTNVSNYWESHYSFDKPSKKRVKSLGDASIDILIINTIVPFLFVYGRQKADESYIEKAMGFLEQIKGEDNAIVRRWKELNVSVKSAYSTQALLQLKNEYCNNKRCLSCAIGSELIKKY